MLFCGEKIEITRMESGRMNDDRPWFKHYDEGVPTHIEYPEITVQEMLDQTARKYPDTAMTIFKGARISYAEMNRITDRLAAGLAALGVAKGDRVGVFMPNSPQFVMAYFAILKIGGVVVATNPLYNDREIEHQLNDADVEVMLVMSNFYNIVKRVQPKTKLRTLVVTNIKETLPGLLRFLFTLTKEKKEGHKVELVKGDMWMKDLISKHTPNERPQVEITPDDIALFQYSGGTTGISKAAVATHRNLVANAIQIGTWFVTVVEGKEILLMAIPLFHVYGMVAGLLLGTYVGASLVMVPNPRDLKDVMSNIQIYSATIFPGVPTLYNAINNNPDVQAGKYNLRSIKACISGSAPLLRETKERFESITGGVVFEGYGLSEAPTATHCNPLLGENRTGSIGLPLPDVDVRIISLDDGVTVLPTGEIGELVVSGPQVMKGYHNMPTETQNVLRDGWLYTGDIAYMDEDGYFFIVDRKKELIKPGGYQVWPREVEEVIMENPKVLEVGVAGVPDAYRGETVKAWVVLKPGEQSSEEEIRDWCRERLAKFKVPTSVEFRDELPKTTVGKILRRELVREHKEQQVESAPAE
jgi:long-chain acyl-CoA synthetase